MPQIALQHANLDYREVGPADSPHPPVLFIHGILVDNRLWSSVAGSLARSGYRCILPNLPLGSHAIPVREGTDLSPRTVATMIAELIDALDLRDVTLVGNDTGGGLCQMVVDAYPSRIGRLVLTNCDAFEKFPPFPFNAVFAMLRSPAAVKAMLAPMRLAAVRHSPIGYGLLVGRPDPALTASWLEPCRTDHRIRRDLAALLKHVARTDLTDVSTRMNRFAKPATLVWGQADRCFTPALGKRLAAQFGAATMVEVPGARTFVSLDDPAAVVDAIVNINRADLNKEDSTPASDAETLESQ